MNVEIAHNIAHVNGVARGYVTASVSGRTVHGDMVNLLSAISRGRFIRGVEKAVTPTGSAEELATVRADLERMLLAEVDAIKSRPAPEPEEAPKAEPRKPKPTESAGGYVLIPGAHHTDDFPPGDYLEIGNHQFADNALRKLPDGTLYTRGAIPGQLLGSPGAKAFRPVTNDGVRIIVDRHARLRKWVTKGVGENAYPVLAFMNCGRDHAGLVLEAAAAHPNVPPIDFLTTYPVYAPGFELSPAGYSGGIYYDRPISLADVQPETDPAVIPEVLDDLVTDFPFKGPADRQNGFAAMLTLIVRPAIDGNVPPFMVKASLERTGKSKLVGDVIGGTIIGQQAAAMQLPDDDAEFDKRITAHLIEGGPLLHLDNIGAMLDSPALASLVTARAYHGRRLGTSVNLTLPNNCLVVGTSNNPRCSGELAKRFIPVTLQPATDSPETRTDFAHPNLWHYVQQRRPLVLSCLLGMVENWKTAGKPSGRIPFGGFDEWAAVVGGIMEVAGYTDFLGNLAEWRNAADERRGDLKALVTEWHRAHGTGPVTVAELLTIVLRLDIFSDILGGKEGKALQTAFGMRVLARNVDTPVGGWIIRRNSLSRPALYALRPVEGVKP